jgi:hypothetical protein
VERFSAEVTVLAWKRFFPQPARKVHNKPPLNDAGPVPEALFPSSLGCLTYQYRSASESGMIAF